MSEEKFFLKVEGIDFTLSFTGFGNMEAAKTALSQAFGDIPVSGYVEDGEQMDMGGK